MQRQCAATVHSYSVKRQRAATVYSGSACYQPTCKHGKERAATAEHAAEAAEQTQIELREVIASLESKLHECEEGKMRAAKAACVSAEAVAEREAARGAALEAEVVSLREQLVLKQEEVGRLEARVQGSQIRLKVSEDM